MNQIVSIHYMHGLGNQFAIIDLTKNNSIKPHQINTNLIKKIIDQTSTYKIDQILFLAPKTNQKADFDYLIYNLDGTLAEQCGNGARCISKYIHDHLNIQNKPVLLHTTDKKITSVEFINNEKIKAVLEQENFSCEAIGFKFSLVKEIKAHHNLYRYQLTENESASLKIKWIDFYAVSMGNPHIVIVVNHLDNMINLENFDIAPIGKLLQSKKDLFRFGINVNFVEISNKDEIKLKTYERGVGETLACGSGACASFVCLKKDNQVHSKLKIKLELGDLYLSHLDNGKIEMIGPACFQETKKVCL